MLGSLFTTCEGKSGVVIDARGIRKIYMIGIRKTGSIDVRHFDSFESFWEVLDSNWGRSWVLKYSTIQHLLYLRIAKLDRDRSGLSLEKSGVTLASVSPILKCQWSGKLNYFFWHHAYLNCASKSPGLNNRERFLEKLGQLLSPVGRFNLKPSTSEY